jgi:hypothetical protein
MNLISSDLLNDTFHLIQLARETARSQGKAEQAERLAPIVDNLRTLVSEARETKTSIPTTASSPSGLLAQDDFRTLLSAIQGRSLDGPTSLTPGSFASPLERNGLILAMAAGGMSEVDIARQNGMTRDEVQLILSVNRK